MEKTFNPTTPDVDGVRYVEPVRNGEERKGMLCRAETRQILLLRGVHAAKFLVGLPPVPSHSRANRRVQ